MAREQLRLLNTPPVSKLDEHTKAVGRRGLAQARAALAEADRRRADRAEQQPRRSNRSAA